jgi:hypothetical protein
MLGVPQILRTFAGQVEAASRTIRSADVGAQRRDGRRRLWQIIRGRAMSYLQMTPEDFEFAQGRSPVKGQWDNVKDVKLSASGWRGAQSQFRPHGDG